MVFDCRQIFKLYKYIIIKNTQHRRELIPTIFNETGIVVDTGNHIFYEKPQKDKHLSFAKGQKAHQV